MNEKRLQAQQEDRDQRDDLRELVALPAGQRFLRRVLEEAAIYRISFVSGDPYATAFNEGRRNLGLWLVAQLSPDELALVMKD